MPLGTLTSSTRRELRWLGCALSLLLLFGSGPVGELAAVTLPVTTPPATGVMAGQDTVPPRAPSRRELRRLEREIQELEAIAARERRLREFRGELAAEDGSALSPEEYALARERSQAEALGLAGFICSLSFLLTGVLGLIVGTVLSAIALSRMRKLGITGRSRSLARAGLIVGVVLLGLIVAIIFLIIVSNT